MKKFKVSFNSPAVLTFSGLCILAFILNSVTDGYANLTVFVTYHSSLTNPMTYVRFFTHVLGHANWPHLIGNMSYILLLGPLLEEKYGTIRITEIILMTAVATALVNYVFFWNVALCGASGICFAFIIMSSFTSFKEGEIPLTFVLIAFIYVGGQINDAIVMQDNISNMAHIVGGIVGALFGYLMNKK
ncbi:MAG: rhomboid family intramembrane serine protease [Clostridiales bacterium]|nr:rhomboid family intramembrane serine protease [Clostridiales bacterium]